MPALSVYILMLLMIPLTGAAVTALFPLLLPLFRKWSQEEYDQALRAPGWALVVITALGIVVSLMAFQGSLTGDGIPAYIAQPISPENLFFLTDAFTVFATLLLFLIVLTVAWPLAARRAFLSVGNIPPVLTAIIIFCSIAIINSASFQLSLTLFIISSLLMASIFFIADSPGDNWHKWIPIFLLIISGIAGIIGYAGLIQFSRGVDIRSWWQMQIYSVPSNVATAIIFVAAAWIIQLIIYTRMAWGRSTSNVLTPLPAIVALTVGGIFSFLRIITATCLQQNMQIQGGITTTVAHSMGFWSFFLTVTGVIIATLMIVRVKKGQVIYEPKGWPIGLIAGGMFLSCFQSILLANRTLTSSIGSIIFLLIGCAVIATGYTIIAAIRLTDRSMRVIIFILSGIALIMSQVSGTGNWWIISQWSGITTILPGWVNIFLIVYSTIICVVYIWKKYQTIVGIEEPGARWGIWSMITTVLSAIVIAIMIWSDPSIMEAVKKSLLQTQ